jgi:hypothetical protein
LNQLINFSHGQFRKVLDYNIGTAGGASQRYSRTVSP